MSLTGNEDHSISLATASAWTSNYRNSLTGGEVIAEYFGKTAISAILNQEDSVGIRFYYSLDDEDASHLIGVGVTTSGNDLYDGLLAENGIQCPEVCSTENPLNSDPQE